MVADDTTPPAGDGERDAQGRFLRGNLTSRKGGNPLAARAHELTSAVRAAVTAEDMVEVMRKMIELAKAGDAVAARLVLERVCGKPTEERAGLGLVLPEIDTAAGVGEAMRTVTHALANGEIDIATGQAVVNTLARVLEVDVVARIEQRLTSLEKKRA